MKRDWQLLGDIFTAIEDERLEAMIGDADDAEAERVVRHLELLADAGLVRGVTIRRSGSGALSWGVEGGGPRITLAGYDLAERVQDRKLLARTISLIRRAGLLVSTETLRHFTPLAVEAIARAAGARE